MSRLSGLAVLVFGSLLALAAPTPENIALAKKYAPQWRFHTSEVYWPSSVEYFLSGPIKQTDGNGNVVNGALTTSNVDDATNQGSGLYLTTDIDAGKASWLRGQNPSTTATAVYTFIAPKDNGVVDLFYWLFTPFNEGKNVPVLGQVGDHVGDWERMTVRTVNGVATQIDYHAHGDTGSGTIPWSQALKFDNDQRPVGYVAKGSHGFWATAGTFTYVNAVVFKLQDLTSDGGVAWDTKNSLVTLAYPDTYSGSLDWLNYKGAWGNLGTTNCWWYVFHDECKIVTGPTGPLRPDVLGAPKTTLPAKDKMQGPLSQTLGAASKAANSSFTFYVDPAAHTLASESGYTKLAVSKTCTSTVEPADKDGKPATTASSTAIQLTKANKFTITPEACGTNSTVTSYAVGLCADSALADCAWAPHRALRAYSADPSVHGIQIATAIVVSDLDNWRCCKRNMVNYWLLQSK
ncbi:putative vacuolar protein sorting-associated protein 62 [Lyophyllum shimeji]|uniref:Vacuolar protein sorting-associated protein 62 n=1 Tax=Lyophyllum shimeji TaxID=47721 RepID=A0A9P3PV90_LYOSH|nr:putative vacuolar protein sorting-associated protein 62 [Lyophyllum shimeji]